MNRTIMNTSKEKIMGSEGFELKNEEKAMVIRTHFSRGNVGIGEFDNPLLEAIADAIEERLEDALEQNPTVVDAEFLKSILKSLDQETIEYRDFGEFYEEELVWCESSDWTDSEALEVEGLDGVYAYVADDYTICLIDENISDGASWGCDSIELIYDQIPCRLQNMIDEVQRALKHDRYELSLDVEDSSIEFLFEGLEDGDIVDSEQVKRIFNDIKEFLSGLDSELFYDEIPIISSDPFATAPKVDFEWEISDREIRFRLYELYREGAGHRRTWSEVIFSPVSDD